MTESSLDYVTQNDGQFPLLHLSGHLTPDTARTEAGAQTVVAQRTLNTQKREVKQCTAQKPKAITSHLGKAVRFAFMCA